MSTIQKSNGEHKVRDVEPGSVPTAELAPRNEEEARVLAIKQIERQRRFRFEVVLGVLGVILLTVIWATSEYHNAHGWPTHGFSESSGIRNVWNIWIVYAIIGIGLWLSSRWWLAYGHRPISEDEIKREIDRQASHR